MGTQALFIVFVIRLVFSAATVVWEHWAITCTSSGGCTCTVGACCNKSFAIDSSQYTGTTGHWFTGGTVSDDEGLALSHLFPADPSNTGSSLHKVVNWPVKCLTWIDKGDIMAPPTSCFASGLAASSVWISAVQLVNRIPDDRLGVWAAPEPRAAWVELRCSPCRSS